MTARYVVIGAGAIGGLLAAQFELAGIDTVLVARGRNLAAIREHGLAIRRPQRTETVRPAVVGGPEELQLTSRDVLVLATKAQDAEAVLAQWAWRPVFDPAAADPSVPVGLGADLPVLTFQNGLATEDLALRRFRRVYGVTIAVAASYLVPGEVVSPSYPVIGLAWVGRYPDQPDPAADEYADHLNQAGYLTTAVADISAWKARKLLGNVGNGLDLLAGRPEQKAEVRARLAAEAAAVFAAAGIPAPIGAPPAPTGLVAAGTLLVEPVPGHTGGRLSTWQSFARGTSSEVDYLNGEIVRLGRQYRVPTPVNAGLQRLLGVLSAAGSELGDDGLDGLLGLLKPVEQQALEPALESSR